MDDIELTQLFVDYAVATKKLQELRSLIEPEVLQRGETVKIAGVTATYYRSSTGTPNYKEVAEADMPKDFDLKPFSTVTTSVRWKEVCDALGITSFRPGEISEARVVIKV